MSLTFPEIRVPACNNQTVNNHATISQPAQADRNYYGIGFLKICEQDPGLETSTD